jgi:uncharacterized protein YjhX (UPF0386 family)
MRIQGKRNSYTLLVRMQISTTTMEVSMAVLQKTKKRSTIQSSDATPGHISEGV